MTWQMLEAASRIDPGNSDGPAADGRNWTMEDMAHLGPVWWGQDSQLNLNWDRRWPAIGAGVACVLLYALLAPSPGGNSVSQGLATLFAVLILLPGLGSIIFGLALGNKFQRAGWRLSAERGRLHYDGGDGPWSVPVAAVARVETGATADWEPVRRYAFVEKRVPRDEVQTFLFMADGSRRVIATVHGGRESMGTLAQSIRTWLEANRAHSDRKAGGDAASDPPPSEGFTL